MNRMNHILQAIHLKCIFKVPDIHKHFVGLSCEPSTIQSFNDHVSVLWQFHCKETFQLVWKRTVSRLSRNCPDVLETFSSVWKPGNLLAYIFLSAHILGCLEVFQTIRKLSVWYISFTGCLLVFLIVWKLSSLKN